MEIDSVYLLIAAIIERARIDANTGDDLTPHVCRAARYDHPASDCGENLIDLVNEHQNDLLELCFEVTSLWLQ